MLINEEEANNIFKQYDAFKKFLKYWIGDRPYFIGIWIMIIKTLAIFFAWGVPFYFISDFLKQISSNPDIKFSDLKYNFFLLCLSIILGALVSQLMDVVVASHEPKMQVKIQNDAHKILLDKKYSFFLRYHSGYLSSRVQQLDSNFESFADSLAWEVPRIAQSFLFAIIFIAPKSPYAFLLFLVFLAISLFSIKTPQKKQNKISSEVGEQFAVVGSVISDTYMNAQTIKAKSNEIIAYDKLVLENDKKRTLLVKSRRNAVLGLGSRIAFFVTLAYISCLLISIISQIYFHAPSSTVFLSSIAFINLTSNIWSIKQLNQMLNNNLSEVASIFTLLAQTDFDNINNQNSTKKEIQFDSSPKIKISDLSFKYTEELPLVLKNIDLTINQFEKVAIVGESGSGKSTLVKLLLNIVSPTEGFISFNEHLLEELSSEAIADLVTYIPQEPLLFSDTLFNNLQFGISELSKDQALVALKKAKLDDFVASLPHGLETHIGEMGVRLSGGQKQRLIIAKAILENNHIIIMDEATSALDSLTEKEIQKQFKNLFDHKTVIAIAHRLSTIRDFDKIIFLEEGRIAEIGTHEELISQKDKYYNFCNLQGRI